MQSISLACTTIRYININTIMTMHLYARMIAHVIIIVPLFVTLDTFNWRKAGNTKLVQLSAHASRSAGNRQLRSGGRAPSNSTALFSLLPYGRATITFSPSFLHMHFFSLKCAGSWHGRAPEFYRSTWGRLAAAPSRTPHSPSSADTSFLASITCAHTPTREAQGIASKMRSYKRHVFRSRGHLSSYSHTAASQSLPLN